MKVLPSHSFLHRIMDTGLRATLENPTIDIPFNFNDYLVTLSNPILNSTVNNSEEIAFDPTEWEITDSRSGKKRSPRQNEFLELLLANARYRSYIYWIDKDQGLCRILLPNQVAALWGKVKHRQTNRNMTYQTFSRGLRYHYTIGSMIKTKKKHTFCLKKTATS